MQILNREQIVARYRPEQALAMIRAGFCAYSRGEVQLPPVQHFTFAQNNGDACVKSGYLAGDTLFAVKVASGFYGNARLGLDSTQGLIMVFSAETGLPVALLLDEGWLTSIRTALAGCLAAKVLAPRRIDAIGIVGTGMQAKLQLLALQDLTPCRTVYVWNRSPATLQRFSSELQQLGYTVHASQNAEVLARACQLIVTCTPATAPILQAEWIQPGTHITAVGADTYGKQELASALVARADRVVVDSIAQCTAYGEVAQAVQSGLIKADHLVELGQIFNGEKPGRQSEQEITLADLTGLAIQDVQIAKSILA